MVQIELTNIKQRAPFSGDAEAAIAALQDRLARLQLSQIAHRKKAIIMFEGWTGSNKKKALKKLVGAFDPLHVRVIAAGGDDADDDRHWLAPFWSRIPSAGETAIFYRSWYRRIVKERVLGAMDDKRWARACDEINEFESQQHDHDTMIAKLFFHITAEQQAANLRVRQEDPWLRHLNDHQPLTELSQWDRTIEVLQDFFAQTDMRWAPWIIIDDTDETAGCIDALTIIADLMEKSLPAEPPAMDEKILQFHQLKTNEQSRA